MAFDWGDFLGLAKEMCAQAPNAAYRTATVRTAISRAYYAAYHAAQDLLIARREYNPPPSLGSHVYVIDTFRTGTDSFRRKIGLDLERLRERRTAADYSTSNAGMSTETALYDAEMAEKVIERVKKLMPGSKSSTD